MLHRSIMLHAEDRIHALITRLRESAAPPERQALLDELTEIEASVHEVAHSVVDYQHVMDELDDNILVTPISATRVSPLSRSLASGSPNCWRPALILPIPPSPM